MCFKKTYRIIPEPPKHVLHLVWSVLGISTAIKTALKVALYDFFDGPLAPLNGQFMEKVNHYNRTKQIDFLMGPSAKFVLAIILLQTTKKVIFFLDPLPYKMSRYFQAEDSICLPGKSSSSLLPSSTPDKSGENHLNLAPQLRGP